MKLFDVFHYPEKSLTPVNESPHGRPCPGWCDACRVQTTIRFVGEHGWLCDPCLTAGRRRQGT